MASSKMNVTLEKTHGPYENRKAAVSIGEQLPGCGNYLIRVLDGEYFVYELTVHSRNRMYIYKRIKKGEQK